MHKHELGDSGFFFLLQKNMCNAKTKSESKLKKEKKKKLFNHENDGIIQFF